MQHGRHKLTKNEQIHAAREDVSCVTLYPKLRHWLLLRFLNTLIFKQSEQLILDQTQFHAVALFDNILVYVIVSIHGNVHVMIDQLMHKILKLSTMAHKLVKKYM